MTLPDDFEVSPSGTHRILTEQQIKIVTVRTCLQLIMDAYPESSAAYQLAEKAYNELNQGEQ